MELFNEIARLVCLVFAFILVARAVYLSAKLRHAEAAYAMAFAVFLKVGV